MKYFAILHSDSCNKYYIYVCIYIIIYIYIGAPIEDFTDIPITDILSRIKADTDNGLIYSLNFENLIFT